MACRDDRRGIAPEIPLLKGKHHFHLKIDQRNYLPKYPISAELRVNPQNIVFHQTFIVNVIFLLPKRKSFYLVTAVTSWNYPAKLQSAVAHQFRVEHCFIAMFFLSCSSNTHIHIHISFKIFMKNAIPIWTIFWRMPHFTPAEIFCQE